MMFRLMLDEDVYIQLLMLLGSYIDTCVDDIGISLGFGRFRSYMI